ncbi:MAG: hypothetical protein U5L01_01305 [Rheinheimera sp.]|nr:hypothetical protein [Rheinheimera sp.]
MAQSKGLYKLVDAEFVLVGDEKLKRAHITHIAESADKSKIVVGTFQSGFGLLQENKVDWFDPERGVPTKSALYIQPIKAAMLVANTDGIYILPEADLETNARNYRRT